jgi:hypothetical protein
MAMRNLGKEDVTIMGYYNEWIEGEDGPKMLSQVYFPDIIDSAIADLNLDVSTDINIYTYQKYAIYDSFDESCVNIRLAPVKFTLSLKDDGYFYLLTRLGNPNSIPTEKFDTFGQMMLKYITLYAQLCFGAYNNKLYSEKNATEKLTNVAYRALSRLALLPFDPRVAAEQQEGSFDQPEEMPMDMSPMEEVTEIPEPVIEVETEEDRKKKYHRRKATAEIVDGDKPE